MSIELKAVWSLNLSAAEMRLVLKALGGRLNSPKEVEDAKDLGDKLTVERASLATNLAREMNKHADAMQERP